MLLEKILNSIYITLYDKTAFGTEFGLREAPKMENLHFHFHAFSGWGTSRGSKSVLKEFSKHQPSGPMLS